MKNELKTLGLDNHGSMLMMFYALLVIPKELIQNEFEDEYKEINKFISQISSETDTNYPSDKPQVQYINHIRNSIAHANISYNDDYIIFNEKYENKWKGINYSFFTSIKRNNIFSVLTKLTEIHMKYIERLQKKKLI